MHLHKLGRGELFGSLVVGPSGAPGSDKELNQAVSDHGYQTPEDETVWNICRIADCFFLRWLLLVILTLPFFSTRTRKEKQKKQQCQADKTTEAVKQMSADIQGAQFSFSVSVAKNCVPCKTFLIDFSGSQFCRNFG